MEFSEIIFLIIGFLFFLFGIVLTIFPNEIGKWLINHSIQMDKSFYFAGYIIGFFGLLILFLVSSG